MIKKISERIIFTLKALRSRGGFTLLEIMVVVTIIAILSIIVVPKFLDMPQKARVVAARQQIKYFEMALARYSNEKGAYPSTEEGLPVLVNEGYIKKNALNDPWGHPYQYRSPGEVDKEFEMWSWGADGKEGGEGFNADIKSWE